MRSRIHSLHLVVAQVVLGLCISPLSMADDQDVHRYNTSVLATTAGGGLELLGRFSEDRYWLISTQFSFRQTKSEQVVVNAFSGEDTRVTETNTNRIRLNTGVRQYLERSEISFFVQPTGGVVVEQTARNSFRVPDVGQEDNSQKSNTLGFTLGCSLGVEYFISKKISVAGIYSLNAEYLNWSFGGDVSNKNFSANALNWVTLSYYWD